MRVPRDFSGLHETPEAPQAPWKPAHATDRPGRSRGYMPGDDGRVLPFRRRAGLPVRRKSRVKELARHFVTALVLVGVPAGSLSWSATSPRFALTGIEVVTTDRVNRAWVESRLEPLLGENLVWMSMAGVERSLAGHPWVRGVEVSKSLPDRMRVAVVERRPVAVLASGESSFWVDREGRLIAPLDAAGAPPGTGRAPEDFLVLREAEALVAAGEPARAPGFGERTRRRRPPSASAGCGAPSTRPRGWPGSIPGGAPASTEIEILGEEDLCFDPRAAVPAAGGGGDGGGAGPGLPAPTCRSCWPGCRTLRGSIYVFEHRMVVRPAAGDSGAGADDGRGELHGQTG